MRILETWTGSYDSWNIDVAHEFKPSMGVGAHWATGTKTTETAGIWDGYSDQLEDDIYTLGKRAFSNERRFHGWIKEDDKDPVTWNCTSKPIIFKDSKRP